MCNNEDLEEIKNFMKKYRKIENTEKIPGMLEFLKYIDDLLDKHKDDEGDEKAKAMIEALHRTTAAIREITDIAESLASTTTSDEAIDNMEAVKTSAEIAKMALRTGKTSTNAMKILSSVYMSMMESIAFSMYQTISKDDDKEDNNENSASEMLKKAYHMR